MGDAAMIDLKQLFESFQHKTNNLLGGSNLVQERKGKKPDFYHIPDLLPYRFYDEDKKMFVNDNSVGFVIEATPLIGANDTVIDTLSGMFNDAVPPGCTIQFINFASPKVGHIFDKWKQPRIAQQGIYKKLAEKRVAHFSDANHKSLFKSGPFTIKDFRLIISVSISTKLGIGGNVVQKFVNAVSGVGENEESIDGIVRKLTSFKETFRTTLRTAGIQSYEMNAEDLINFLDEVINFNVTNQQERLKYDHLQPLNKQIVSGENYLRIEKDKLTLFADNPEKAIAARCFSARNFPTTWAQWQCRDLIGDYFEDLRRMEHPFLTSFAVTLPRNEESLRSKAVSKNFNAQRLRDSELSKFVPTIKDQAAEWNFVVDKINKNQRILKAVYQAVVFAPPTKINEAEQTLKSIYKSCGWDIARDNYVGIQSFLATLPFTQSEGLFEDLEKMGKTKTMISWTCANVAPLQAEWSGVDSPMMLFFGRRGQPMFWNPFRSQRNYNVAVVGTSGSGKSFLMQELVTGIRGFGGKVYVIDDGRSFMNSCKLQGGQFVEFGSGSKICLNPFSIINMKAAEKDSEYEDEIIKLIKSMVAQMCKATEAVSDFENGLIEQAVIKTWNEYREEATITKIRDYLNSQEDHRAKDLAMMMTSYSVGGIYGNLFEGEANIRLDNLLMVFELAELKSKKELQAIVMMFLMFLVSEAMYFGDRKTPIALVIDEAWDLLHGEGTKFFIEGFARRARKYGGTLITGTQSINDYYKNSTTEAVINNTEWKLILSQTKETIAELERSKKIVMDEFLKRSLSSLRKVDGEYSELIIYNADASVLGRLIIDPYSAMLFSSKAEDWSAINHMMSQGYDLASALEKLSDLAQKNKKNEGAKFLGYKDFQKIIQLKNDGTRERSFEDVLEEVIKHRMFEEFPRQAEQFYNTNSARSS